MTTSRHPAVRTYQRAEVIAASAQPAATEAFQTDASGISLYRLKQVLARIPISRSAWFAGMQAGRYPRSYSLGPRTTVWRSDDIDQVVARLTSCGGPHG